ncbi:hypothetical protein SNEBB_001865 [Seison nebaliae]|nr:hypothetical protein SNEBB_001865 [Seison nebaliae]
MGNRNSRVVCKEVVQQPTATDSNEVIREEKVNNGDVKTEYSNEDDDKLKFEHDNEGILLRKSSEKKKKIKKTLKNTRKSPVYRLVTTTTGLSRMFPIPNYGNGEECEKSRKKKKKVMRRNKKNSLATNFRSKYFENKQSIDYSYSYHSNEADPSRVSCAL